MCVIIHLEPNFQMPDTALDNAIKNNSDGFGLITAKGGRLKVLHDVNPKKETELEQVKEVLEEDASCHRYLHLRFNTKGCTTLENAHPFKVMENKKNSVWMMHNGTISGFGSHTGQSDTAEFNEKILSPLIDRMKFKNGFVDVNDPLITSVVESFIGPTNRILLINKDNKPNFIGSWKSIICTAVEGEPEFMASNDTYFNDVVRGSHSNWGAGYYGGSYGYGGSHRPAKKTQNTGSPSHWSSSKKESGDASVPFDSQQNKYMKFRAHEEGVSDLADYAQDLMDMNPQVVAPEDLGELLKTDETDVWDVDTLSLFSYMTMEELLQFTKVDNPQVRALFTMFVYMAGEFEALTMAVDHLEDDKKKAQEMIATLKNEQGSNLVTHKKAAEAAHVRSNA